VDRYARGPSVLLLANFWRTGGWTRSQMISPLVHASRQMRRHWFETSRTGCDRRGAATGTCRQQDRLSYAKELPVNDRSKQHDRVGQAESPGICYLGDKPHSPNLSDLAE